MIVPPRYSKELALAGGLNPFGEPVFRLHWGNDPVPRKLGPPDRVCPSMDLACWLLLHWTPPEEYGSELSWPAEAGPYPNHGRYEPVTAFRRDGEPAMLDSVGLNLEVLRYMVQVVQRRIHDSLAERGRSMKAIREQKEERRVRRIADCLTANSPRFTDAVSFAGQKNLKSEVQRRVELLEQNYQRVTAAAAAMPRGISQGA